MAAGLLLAGAAGLVVLLLARGMQRRPEEQQLVVPVPAPALVTAPAPAVVPAVAPVVPAPAPFAPPPAPKRYQILEVYLWDQEGGVLNSTFSLTRVMQRASWPFVRYRVHVQDPMQMNVVASVEGFVLGRMQMSGDQVPEFDPMRVLELNVPSTPGTYQLLVLFSGANYEEARSLSLTIVP